MREQQPLRHAHAIHYSGAAVVSLGASSGTGAAAVRWCVGQEDV